MKEIAVESIEKWFDDVDTLLHTKESEAQHWYEEYKSMQDDLMEIAQESEKVFEALHSLDVNHPEHKVDYSRLQSLIHSARYFWDPNRDDKHYE